jgi:prepilin-type N-terminal cleavage/methylation domain-containing protein
MNLFKTKFTGFTLIELVVVISIITTLSLLILFSVTLYINKGKDASISGNLAILITAGEVFYNGNSNSYQGFCDPTTPNGNSVIRNTINQMPDQTSTAPCYGTLSTTTNTKGVCCNVADQSQNYQSWAACAREFTNPSNAFCVDSRGVKEEMCATFCNNSITKCPDVTACP